MNHKGAVEEIVFPKEEYPTYVDALEAREVLALSLFLTNCSLSLSLIALSLFLSLEAREVRCPVRSPRDALPCSPAG